jgi:FHS family Na+ dependent glucose MFS transporter 1
MSIQQEQELGTPRSTGSLTAMIVIYLGFALTGVAVTLLGSALPALMRRFSLTDLQAGTLFTAQFLCSTLGATLSGRLVSRHGFKFILVGGFALIALGIGALAFLSWPSCLIAICCYGIGIGITIPACNLHVAATNPHRRAGALNLLNFVWTAGALAWAPFAATLSARPMSFLWLGLFVALFTVWLALTHLPEGKIEQNTSQPGVFRTIPLQVYVLTALVFFLYIGVENSWAGWSTSFAQRLNPSNHLWIFAPSFFWGALLAGRALAPLLLKLVSEDLLLVLDLAVATAAGCALLMTSNTILMFAALSLLGFALASVYPNLIAKMTRDLEANPGATGYMFASSSTGGAIIPWVVGAVSTSFGSIRAGLSIAIAASTVMLILQALRPRNVTEKSPGYQSQTSESNTLVQ